jgi:DNA modification methylase
MLVENEGFTSTEAWNNLKVQIQSKTKVSFIEKNLKERQINDHNKNKAKGQKHYNDDYFKLIHDDSRNIGNHITGEVIDNVTTSPPYFSMKLYLEDDVNVKGSGRRNLKTKQIGQENTIPKYIDSLMDVLTEVNNVLKETGSVFINVMDSSIDGITQRIPDKLINAYEESGVTFVQYIYWYKRNVLPRYADDKKFQTSMEYILHFVKNPKKYKWYKKWVNKEDEFWGEIVIGGKGKEKVFRNILIYPDPKDELNGEEVKNTAGLIQSNVINNHSLNKLLKEKGYQLQHNALYSVEIPMICIMSTTQPGDTVLDPWSGMATTGIVAFANGCKYYGFDQSKVYTAQASVRIEDFLEKNKDLIKRTEDTN